MKPLFFDISKADLETFVKEKGHPAFRARQLFQWVYSHGVLDFAQMTNLSEGFKAEAAEWFDYSLPKVVKRLESKDTTIKLLIELRNGKRVEMVIIPAGERRTLCVSSEVGCNLACKFCFTGTQKLQYRLSSGEIIAQLILARAELDEEARPVSNIVFMGMGEPLDNDEAVFAAIDVFTDPIGFGLGKKRVTVSTSGIVPKMHKVADAGVGLAVSLNGSSDEIRSKIMPVNKRWPIDQLMDACQDYIAKTNNRVTFEYVLLKGVTDSLEDAERLSRLVRGISSKINIIPFNPFPGSQFLRPSEGEVQRFHRELTVRGVLNFRRKTMGDDVLAACGQLTES